MPSADRVQNMPGIPEWMTLQGFADVVAAQEGVSLADLEPRTSLRVHTVNSLYQIVVIDGTTVRVQGGRFADVTEVHLNGSSLGHGPLKLGCIAVGLRMEMVSSDRRVVTSPVLAITIER